MHFVEALLEDFGGISLRIPIERATLLCGYNGAGKTTLLEAIHLAVTGGLPGQRMDTALMQSLSGPTGQFAIEVADSEGGKIRRECLGVQSRARANFGSKSTSSKNEDHDQAIRERYGDFAVSLDMSALINMSPDSLRDFVLDLCERGGGASAWTTGQVISEVENHVTDVGREPDLIEIPEGCESPLALLDLLDQRVSESLTECRRGIIEANRIRSQAVPESPTPDTMESGRGAVQEHEDALARTQEERGAILADDSGGRAAEIKGRIAGKEAALASLQAEIAKAKREAANFDGQLTLARQVIEKLEASEPEAVDVAAIKRVALAMADERKLNADAASARVLARAALQSAEDRAARFAAGTCPECGQSVEELRGGLRDEIGGLEKAKVAADKKAAKSNRQIDQLAQILSEAENASIVRASWQEDLGDARSSLGALGALREKAVQLRDGLAARIKDTEAAIKEMSGDLGRLRAPSDPARKLAEVDQCIAKIKTQLATVRDDHERGKARVRAASEAIAARDAAENEHSAIQEWQATLKKVVAELLRIRRQVVSAYVDPLVGRVSAVLGDHLGEFGVRFEPRFQIGFARGGAWVPLHRLSTGEFALAALAIGYALCDLRDPPMRLLILDGVSEVDPVNRGPFLETAGRMIFEGAMDQILLAGMGRAEDYQGGRVTILDMDAIRRTK